MCELLEIKKRFQELQNKYQAYLPKVDPNLIHDLLTRQQENPQVTPMYMVEVFTKRGIDSQAARNYIFEKTGMVAAVYDHGTHYVTNQKLTLEMLKEISNSEARDLIYLMTTFKLKYLALLAISDRIRQLH
jgi:hypothetical protein